MKKLYFLLFFVVSAIGCATIDAHVAKPSSPAPYTGTGQALKATANSVLNYDYYGEVFVKAWDVPLCFIADTLLLPYDLFQVAKTD